VPAQDETVVHAFCLVIFEGKQLGEGGRFGFVQDGFGLGSQGTSTRPFEVGSVGDLAEQAVPFDDDAVNVALAEEVGDPGVFV
jgi:hypothetical protein